ncbi:hypothetical protein BDV10DRAFT_158633 [Aspergillus recurvatus]
MRSVSVGVGRVGRIRFALRPLQPVGTRPKLRREGSWPSPIASPLAHPFLPQPGNEVLSRRDLHRQ